MNAGYKWEASSADKFIQTLETPIILNVITVLKNTTFEQSKDGINKYCTDFEQIISSAANMCLKKNFA